MFGAVFGATVGKDEQEGLGFKVASLGSGAVLGLCLGLCLGGVRTRGEGKGMGGLGKGV